MLCSPECNLRGSFVCVFKVSFCWQSVSYFYSSHSLLEIRWVLNGYLHHYQFSRNAPLTTRQIVWSCQCNQSSEDLRLMESRNERSVLSNCCLIFYDFYVVSSVNTRQRQKFIFNPLQLQWEQFSFCISHTVSMLCLQFSQLTATLSLTLTEWSL